MKIPHVFPRLKYSIFECLFFEDVGFTYSPKAQNLQFTKVLCGSLRHRLPIFHSKYVSCQNHKLNI